MTKVIFSIGLLLFATGSDAILCWKKSYEAKCSNYAACNWNAKDNECNLWCFKNGSKTKCQKYDACKWNGTEGKCQHQDKCWKISTEAICKDAKLCQWDTSAGSCKQKPTGTPPTTTPAPPTPAPPTSAPPTSAPPSPPPPPPTSNPTVGQSMLCSDSGQYVRYLGSHDPFFYESTGETSTCYIHRYENEQAARSWEHGHDQNQPITAEMDCSGCTDLTTNENLGPIQQNPNIGEDYTGEHNDLRNQYKAECDTNNVISPFKTSRALEYIYMQIRPHGKEVLAKIWP